jgi:hypothetical protein
LGTPPRLKVERDYRAEQGDYTRESGTFTAAAAISLWPQTVYNTLMQPESPEPTQVPSGWQYNQEQPTIEAMPASTAPTEEIEWTASEFIAHQKNRGWYLFLGVGAIVLSAAMYLLTKDLISVTVVLIVAVLLGFAAGRKPRILNYRMDASGIYVGSKTYSYGDFKSFSVVDEGAVSSIGLLPMKRFMPPLSIYYEPTDEDHIVGILGARLPYEDRQKDAFDRLLHKVRF